jgi:hypothetical protein
LSRVPAKLAVNAISACDVENHVSANSVISLTDESFPLDHIKEA